MTIPWRIWSFCVKGYGHKYRKIPKLGALKLRSLGIGDMYTWPPRNTHLPHVCYPDEMVILGQTAVLLRRSAWSMTLASSLSRSLKVIETDTDRSATYDFLLTFYSNQWPVSYRFPDKRQLSEIANFPNSHVFNVPAE